MRRGFGRFFKILGIFFAVLLLIAVAVPFFVDVDKYRPQIVQLANDHLNGNIELGKLKLSLWGQIRVDIDGFTLSDAGGHRVVSSKEVFFHIPLLPLLQGSPVLTFKLVKPEIFIVKNKQGKLNVTSLMKPSATDSEPKKRTVWFFANIAASRVSGPRSARRGGPRRPRLL